MSRAPAGPGQATAYWVTRPGRGELRTEALPPAVAGDLQLDTAYSAVSAGTERLVGLGLVPAECHEVMACRGMAGSLRLPVKYGYSLVGQVAAGPTRGQRLFAMHPHQDRVVIAGAQATMLPDAVPDARATLLPNLETALNGVWDGELLDGEKVAVVGAGVVGLLVAFVLAKTHRGDVQLADADPARVAAAARLPWIRTARPAEELPRGAFAAAFHATGHGAGLQRALDCLATEGRVVDLSWYGARPVNLQLGTDFHWRRLRILGSQVATVASSHRALGHAGRMAKVLELLQDRALDALLPEPLPFADLPAAMHRLYAGEPMPPLLLVRYGPQP
jgi:2-desacetyl-2-hydroxyethyl bacteriochlorophyllide A dehydrogenase